MASTRHRRSASRPEGGGGWFALGALGIAFAATWAGGGVGFMESRGVAALAWTLGALGVAGGRGREGDPWAGKAAGAAMILLGWCAFQLAPLPGFVQGWAWRVDGGWLREIASEAGGMSIALDRFVSLHAVLLWSGLGVLAWGVARQVRGRPELPRVLYGLAALGAFQSLLGLFFLKAPGGGRICGSFGSPNALAGLLAMTIPVTLGLLLHLSSQPMLRGRAGFQWWFHRLGDNWRTWRSPVLWLALAIQWTALYFTGSIGGSAMAAAGFGILLVWHGRERPEFRGRLWALGAGVGILWVAIGLHGMNQNVLDRALGDSGEFEHSKASRVEIWRAAAKVCQAFPLGTGPGGTVLALPMHQTGVHGRYRLDYAHNDALQFWGDLGPVGFGALAWLVGLTVWRGAKTCRRASERGSGSEWLRRGAWVAVLAALGHAQVEFNLSARPGLQVVFAILCGILWGGRSAAAASGEGGGRRMGGTERGVLAGAAVAVALSLAAAWAWRIHEGAVESLGLAPGEQGWFRAPALAPEDAVDALRRAIRWAPDSAALWRVTAEAGLASHERQVRRAARSALGGGGTEAGEGAFDAPDAASPGQREALEMARMALRVEEAEMLRAAWADAEEAVRRAPRDAGPWLTRSQIGFRGAGLGIFEASAEARGRRDLEIATGLYPSDAGVLAEACSVLSRAPLRDRDVEALLDWGSRALEMDGSLAWTVLASWRAGKVPVARILEKPHLPLSCLWSLHTAMDEEGREEDAIRCLGALERRLATARPPEASSIWTESMWKRWEIQLTQYRIRLATEWLRRHLRNGDWIGLEAMAASRAEARHERFQMEWAKMELEGEASVVLRRLRLREWNATRGLSPEWALEWGLLELEAGTPARQLQEPLAEILLLDGLSGPALERLRACRAALADAPFLAGLVEAKGLEAEGRAAEAAAALAALREEGVAPGRFEHRVWGWQADLLRRAGQAEAAEEALRRAVEACSTDPDVGGGAAEGLTHGEPRLDIGYKGGRVVLRHACLEAEAGSGPDLHLVWRFRGGLPPDLQIEVRIHDGEGHLLHRKVAEVDREEGARFNRGNPPPGSQWTWTISLPPVARDGREVEVRLRAASKGLASDEGLSSVKCPMGRLPWVKSGDGGPGGLGGCVRRSVSGGP